MGKRMLRAGLRLYDFFGSGVPHKALSVSDLLMLAPRLRLDRLSGGFWYRDAQTDDARLVLRVLFDALAGGGDRAQLREGGRAARSRREGVRRGACAIASGIAW